MMRTIRLTDEEAQVAIAALRSFRPKPESDRSEHRVAAGRMGAVAHDLQARIRTVE